MASLDEQLRLLKKSPPRKVVLRWDGEFWARFLLMSFVFLLLFQWVAWIMVPALAQYWGSPADGTTIATWIGRTRHGRYFHAKVSLTDAQGQSGIMEIELPFSEISRIAVGEHLPVHYFKLPLLDYVGSYDNYGSALQLGFGLFMLGMLAFAAISGFLSFLKQKRTLENGALHRARVLERLNGKYPKTLVSSNWPGAPREKTFLAGLPEDSDAQEAPVIVSNDGRRAFLVTAALIWEVQEED